MRKSPMSAGTQGSLGLIASNRSNRPKAGPEYRSRLRTGQPRNCGSVLWRCKTFISSTKCPRPAAMGQQASYSTRTVGCFPGGTAAEAWSWPLTPYNAEATNEWSEASTSTYTAISWTGKILLYGRHKHAIHNSRLHAYGVRWEGD